MALAVDIIADWFGLRPAVYLHHRPPTPPPSPSPAPPDMDIAPTRIFTETETAISIGGSFANEGDRVVFMLAGSLDCDGATQAQFLRGDLVSSGRVTVTIDIPESTSAAIRP